MQETQIVGHPGSGKTTYLTKQIARAAREVGHEKVLVGSFTNAAAIELVGRGLVIPKNQIGTLHSHAFRTIGPTQEVADTTKWLTAWNEEHPDMALSGGQDVDDEVGFRGKTDGDRMYAAAQVFRARMKPVESWGQFEGGYEAARFHRLWSEFKKGNDIIDFTDMVEIALRDTSAHYMNPSIAFWDEFQDFTQLEAALIAKWGAAMTYGNVYAGDPNQTIYGFKGSSPDYMLRLAEELPPERNIELPRSYRVPKAVQWTARNWLARASRYIPPNYEPREDDGFVEYAPHITNKDADTLVADLEHKLKLTITDRDGRTRPATIMIQAACSYMIDPIKNALKKAGIPFHNPWRRSRGDWNPLTPANGVSAAQRLYSLMRPAHSGDDKPWTWEEVSHFAAWLSSKGNMNIGAKKRIQDNAAVQTRLELEDLMALFSDDALEKIWMGEADWYADAVLPSHKPKLDYPRAIVDRSGVNGLKEWPRVSIGTIHSFKGTEADIVYVLPDISFNSFVNEWANGDVDSIVRMFYVAMTRSYHGLVLCGSASKYIVDWGM